MYVEIESIINGIYYKSAYFLVIQAPRNDKLIAANGADIIVKIMGSVHLL